MGASHEMGRNEVCIWRSALPAVVQSIHGPASATPVAVDPWSPRRAWVLCLRAGQTDAAHQHLTVSRARFLVCPSWPWLRWTCAPWGCPSLVGDRATGCSSGTPVHHNHNESFVFSLSHADVDPTPLVCTSMLNNWNVVVFFFFNMSSFLVCLCVFRQSMQYVTQVSLLSVVRPSKVLFELNPCT